MVTYSVGCSGISHGSRKIIEHAHWPTREYLSLNILCVRKKPKYLDTHQLMKRVIVQIRHSGGGETGWRWLTKGSRAARQWQAHFHWVLDSFQSYQGYGKADFRSFES
jgi:hypothetical protein